MANQDRVGRLFQQVSGNQKAYYVLDDRLVFADPADTTKRVRFDVGAVTTGTTRTITVPDASGVLPATQLVRADAVKSLGNTTNATDMFNEDVTLKAATSYRFRLVWKATTGATSTTLSVLFAGTATITTIDYLSLAVDAASGTAAAALLNNGEAATAVVVGAAGTGVNKRIWIEGEVEVNAAGTFIPQIKFSADPTGTCQTDVGSFFEIWELGAAPVTTIGAFA